MAIGKLLASVFSAVICLSAIGAAAGGAIYSQQTNSSNAEIVPEKIQEVGANVTTRNDLPTYQYKEQEIEVYNGNQKIYGVAYIPEIANGRKPLVICAHGLGGSYRSNLSYAKQLAEHGIASYCFDFRGGGGTMSDGDVTQMSVMTEVSDLECVLQAAQSWDFVDSKNISLLGTSQGGIVSAITAARHSNEIKGVMLCYPAFLVHDAVHEQFASLDEVPDSYQFNWMTLGRPYAEDVWDYDVYAEIGNYSNKILLMHGTADNIVPISYSDKAAEVYSDVEYYQINGAGHGFSGTDFEEALDHIFDYIQEIGVISNVTVDYSIDDVRNLQDFLLAKPVTEDLTDKQYDLNYDGRWNVFDLCLMKRHLLQSGISNQKKLVVYFSTPEITDATTTASRVTVNGKIYGTTEYIAQVIYENTESDLFKIELEVPYGTDVPDRAKNEQENNILPELSTHIENFDSYDTVFVGYPTWWYDMPQVMYSFFEEYDFSGKTIIPFNSHGGSQFSGSIEKIIALEPDANVIKDGLTLSRGIVADSEEQIIEWVMQFS